MRTLIIAISIYGLVLVPLTAADEGIRTYRDAPAVRTARPVTARSLSPIKAPAKYTPVHDTAIDCRYYGYSYSTNDFWGTPQTPLLYTYEGTAIPPVTSYPVKVGFDSDWENEHSRGHFQFDLHQLPDSITALSAGLRVMTAYDTQWPHEWDSWTEVPVVVRGMWRNQAAYTPHDGDASSWDLYNDAGDGSVYGTHNLSMDAGYNLEWPSSSSYYDLGSQAVADLNGSWALGWFGVGLALPDESADRGINLWGAAARLHLTYKYSTSHPTLYGPAVTPLTGEAGITVFTYAVSYVDSCGYPADSASLVIDGTRTLAMSATGDPTDCRFICKTTLATPGTHTYRFRFHSSFGRSVEFPASGACSNPAVSLHAGPYVVQLRSTVIDSGSLGNGDGILNSGESARLRVWVKNVGSDSARMVTGTISTGDPNIGVIVACDSFGTIGPLDSAAVSRFTVAAAAATPYNYVASLVLRCRDQNGNQWATNLLLPVNALFFDNADDSCAGCFAQQDSLWHRTMRASYSPTRSWWCGNESTGTYGINSNASLMSAEFLVGHDQQLSFWHRVETEVNYDSCFVELTTDGGAHWNSLAAFNGDGNVWTKQTYDLSAVGAGTPVQIRFRFKSDNSINKQGWFIDDIRVGPATAYLGNGSLAPSIGDTAQQFTYAVAYTSAANAPPCDSTVIIDGVAHPMVRVGGTYLAGARYSYTARLPWGNSHQYLFYFGSDGQTLQCPSSGYADGPWVGQSVFKDDFEHGLSNWAMGHRFNSLDWSLSGAAWYSPVHCLTDSRDSTYRDSTDNWAGMAGSVDLSAYAWAKAGWFEKYWTESGYDHCMPEVSSDNGVTWSMLISKYSGLDTVWHERVADLSAFCGKAAPLALRFHLTSDQSIHYDGWYVDDVQIIGGWPAGVGQEAEPEIRSANDELRMEQNHPNPFTLTTAISYQLSVVSRVRLKVYNITGQEVKTLMDQEQSAGRHQISWDGRDQTGQRAAAGIYFYRLTARNKTIIKKMVVLK